MRVRTTATTLVLTTALLAVPACSTNTTGSISPTPGTSASTPAGTPARADENAAPLSSAALEARLLDEEDLGSGYLRKPQHSARHDDVTVVGCPALDELGGGAPTARRGSQTLTPAHMSGAAAAGSSPSGRWNANFARKTYSRL